MAVTYGNYGGYNAGQQNNSMIAFISDNALAVNYPVAPNTTVALINVSDTNDSKMFIKSTQPNGMPNPTRVFELKEVTPQTEQTDSVSRQEFDNLNKQLEQLKTMLAGLTPAKKTEGGKAK